jgi:hypothetical protein
MGIMWDDSSKDFEYVHPPRRETKETVVSSPSNVSQQSLLINSPHLHTMGVGYRSMQTLTIARRLRWRLYKSIPSTFSILVSNMEDSDDVAKVLEFLNMNKDILTLTDIYHVMKECKESEYKISPSTLELLASDKQSVIIPESSSWLFLLSSIRSYLWHPSTQDGAASKLLQLMLVNDMVSIAASNVDILLSAYGQFFVQETALGWMSRGDMPSILKDSLSSMDPTDFITHDQYCSQSMVEAIGRYSRPDEQGHYHYDTNAVAQYVYDYALDEIKDSIDYVDYDGRSHSIDQAIFKARSNISTLITSNKDFRHLVDKIDKADKCNTSILNDIQSQMEMSALSVVGNIPGCIIDYAIKAWKESGTVESLIEIRSQLQSILSVLKAGMVMDMLSGIGTQGIWDNLKAFGMNIIGHTVSSMLHGLLNSIRSKMHKIPGINNSILQCAGVNTLVDEANGVANDIVSSFYTEIDKITNRAEARSKCGSQLSKTIGKRNIGGDIISLLEDVIAVLNSIINIDDPVDLTSDVVDAYIGPIVATHSSPVIPFVWEREDKEKIDDTFGYITTTETMGPDSNLGTSIPQSTSDVLDAVANQANDIAGTSSSGIINQTDGQIRAKRIMKRLAQ